MPNVMLGADERVCPVAEPRLGYVDDHVERNRSVASPSPLELVRSMAKPRTAAGDADLLQLSRSYPAVSTRFRDRLGTVMESFGRFYPACFEGLDFHLFDCEHREELLDETNSRFVEGQRGKLVVLCSVLQQPSPDAFFRLTGVAGSEVFVGGRLVDELKGLGLRGLDVSVGNQIPSFLRRGTR